MSKELEPLLTALNEVMKAAAHVTKNGWNDFHRYKYATEEDVLAVVRPAMVENGLMLIPTVQGDPRIDEHGNTHLNVAYTLVHKSGARWPEPIVVPGCGNDRAKNGNIGDKGTYKALTGANKYLLFKLFQIATGDDPEVPNRQERPDKNGRPPANGNGQKVAPKNGRDAIAAFFQKDSLAMKVPADPQTGELMYAIWVDKFTAAVGSAPSPKHTDKLCADNVETITHIKEHCVEGLWRKIDGAVKARHKYFADTPAQQAAE